MIIAGEEEATCTAEGDCEASPYKEMVISDTANDNLSSTLTLKVQRQPKATKESPYHDSVQLYTTARGNYDLIVIRNEKVLLPTATPFAEMLAHIPLLEHSLDAPERILVVGEGAVGMVPQVLKHASVTHVDVTCRDLAVAQLLFDMDDPYDSDTRLHIHSGEAGSKFIPSLVSGQDVYDVILLAIDVPAQSSQQLLSFMRQYLDPEHGVLLAVSSNNNDDIVPRKQWRDGALAAGFKTVRYGTVSVASMGTVGFFVCHQELKATQPGTGSLTRMTVGMTHRIFENLADSLTYYHPRMHVSSFVLPLSEEQVLYGIPDE